MARRSLPPGFRFHPTDVELVMYYLKRKITGKKLHFESISEVNIYKFSPWDLPDKSCLKSKDLEWFFFCPIERKYSSGVRVKRATENGYWKTTGKDRLIHYNDKTVGTVKTLVFHLGHAPKGERTDWVIHEYRIIDDQLASAGIQDLFVLCKVFRKSGPGPKNGAQYGAPFNEADWTDDEDDGVQNQAISLAAEGPHAAAPVLAEKQSSVVIEPFDLGNTSRSTLVEERSQTSAGPPPNEVSVDDEITNLLSMFTEDATFPYKNGNIEDGVNDKGKDEILPGSDGFDIYNGLGDLDNWGQMNKGRLDLLEIQQDGYSLNDTLWRDDVGYIELNDLRDAYVIPPDLLAPGVLGSHGHEIMQPFCPSWGYTGLEQCGSTISQPMTLPDALNNERNCLGEHQMVNGKPYNLPNTEFASDLIQKQPENGVSGHFIQDMERGRQKKISTSRISDTISFRSPSAAVEHLALHLFRFSGSSMHIKAEVTCGAGECSGTKEALSLMMGESGSCWWNLLWADFLELQVLVRNHLVYLVDYGFDLVLIRWCFSWILFPSRAFSSMFLPYLFLDPWLAWFSVFPYTIYFSILLNLGRLAGNGVIMGIAFCARILRSLSSEISFSAKTSLFQILTIGNEPHPFSRQLVFVLPPGFEDIWFVCLKKKKKKFRLLPCTRKLHFASQIFFVFAL